MNDDKGAMTPYVPSDSVKRLLPWLVAVAFFMESLDTTILSTAVPTLATALKVAPLNMKSVLASYTLSLAIFIPVSGWLADRFGTRRVFASAIGLFTLSSFFCGLSSNVDMLVFFRVLQGCGGALMMPVGRLTMVRTFQKSELLQAMSFVVIPGLVGPMLGPLVGGFIVAYLHWSFIFFVNIPIGLLGLYLVYQYLPDYRSETITPLDVIGLLLFGSGIGVLSYTLEVFGEHSLSGGPVLSLFALSIILLIIYGFRSVRIPYPLLRLSLFRLRTFRCSVLGGFITRLGIGGVPFLSPLLYQICLGFTPIESGLLIMPQALAAMSLKAFSGSILSRFGHRNILLWNTILLGVLIMLLSTIGPGTPVWLIVIQVFCMGFTTSLQFTSMNTLAYADVSGEETSKATTITSAMQQMSMSFGVATASLTTAFFVPDRIHSTQVQLIGGIHDASLVLGGLTIISAFMFCELHADDGASMSQHKIKM